MVETLKEIMIEAQLILAMFLVIMALGYGIMLTMGKIVEYVRYIFGGVEEE